MTNILMHTVLSLIIFLSPMSSNAEPLHCDGVKESFLQYLNKPNERESKKLLKALSICKLTLQNRPYDWEDLLDKHYADLEKILKRGDINATNISFKIREISDGSMAELMSMLLGSIIIEHPAIFLKSLENNYKDTVRLDALLGNLGPEYVDKPEVQLKELRKRYRAINLASNVSLSVKNRCLSVLKKRIDKTFDWLQEEIRSGFMPDAKGVE